MLKNFYANSQENPLFLNFSWKYFKFKCHDTKKNGGFSVVKVSVEPQS